MWVLLILALAAMSALTIIQTPKEWFKNKVLRVVLIVYHSVGVASLALILFAVYRMKDGFWRELIVWTETCYFTLTIFGLFLSVVRYLGFEFARHFKHGKVLRVLGNYAVFFLAVIIVSAAYMVPSIYNALNIRTVTYDVTLEKSCDDDNLSVAVVSDFHVGGGARHEELDKMLTLLKEADPDLVLIGGDVCDSSSSVSDIEYMASVLKQITCRYGVFYAEGNHEVECRTDPDPYLESAGITILKDKGVRIANGLNIVGRKNALKTDVGEIMDECGLDKNAPTIVLQHRTKGLAKMDGVADLAVCGHTHGYQFPFEGLMEPLREMSYGYRKYGNAQIIVSSGVAEWGYRTKWPSRSEVTIININFKEAA